MKRRNLFLNGLAFLMCLFLFAGGLSAQTQQKTVEITSNGTWTVPTELDGHPITVKSVTFHAWGGGGAGGYAYSSGILKSAGGGGGAAYAKSATITNMTPGESFTITVGAGGTAIGDDPDHYTVKNGGTTTVYRGETLLAKAVGGKSVTGTQNINGAAGGNASECFGDGATASGGKGGNAYPGLSFIFSDWPTGAWCISGSGGGAGGPGGNGGNANNSEMRLGIAALWNAFINGDDMGQITGVPGAGNGGYAGSGAWGRESQIFGGAGWGNAGGYTGNNYGGGGSGAIGNGLSWGDANGGAGGPGAVVIYYTYTSEEIEVADATANFCSGAAIDLPLNVTLSGIAPANVTVKSITTDLTNATISYNAEDEKFHFTANAYTNPNTTAATFTATCKLKDNTTVESNEFTVTVTVYGKLDGGVIAADQIVCQNQTIQTLMGDGTVVHDVLNDYGDVTTAPATGGSGKITYQWYMHDYVTDTYSAITGANTANYIPGNGAANYYREYRDTECGVSGFATDASGIYNNLYVVTVNPIDLTPVDFSEDTVCSNVGYEKRITWYEEESPSWAVSDPSSYWQRSTDKGATWENIKIVPSGVYSYLDINLIPGSTDNPEYTAGADIWYRVAIKFWDCDSIPSNGIHKIHVKEVPNYADPNQFPDINITLWYGACDTSIANLPAPELTPEPAEITRADEYTRVAPGEYTIKWRVKPDPDCDIYDTYDQKVIVKYPECGTVETPVSFTNPADLEEYQTIRIGCECWLAENLRTNAAGAVYYDEDEANKPFGKLYNWNDAVAVNNTEMTAKTGAKYIQGVCPKGWSIPSVGQYTTLMGEGLDALKSNEEGTWLPGKLGTNASGFNMKGAGLYEAGQFKRMLGYADFWTSGTVEGNSTVATAVEARYDCDEMMPKNMNKENKISVRCVRIEPAE